MTRTIGLVDRIRWMLLVGALGVLGLTWSAALAASHGQLPSLRGASSSSAGGSSAPLDPRIASIAALHPNKVVQTIVQFKAGVGVERARWNVAHASGTVFGELPIINGLAVKLTAAHARELAASPAVHAVSLNSEVTVQNAPLGPAHGLGHHGSTTSDLQTTYDGTLGVMHAWQDGITGEGVGVAVIDTGIDGNLPDFQASTGHASRVVETAVTNAKAQTATDSYGHGTDVAGIIAGDGDNLSRSDPLHGHYIGVAPDANLISIKVSDEQGRATVLDVIYGLQFAVDHRSDFNIRVVNLSLDAKTPQSYTTDPLDAAVESAWMHGIVVVAAAGNRGSTPDAVQYAPANDPYVITVGAVAENGTSDPADDAIASWSSRGTTQDGFQKPDVYAPGEDIVSVLAPGSQFESMCPACIIGGEYIRTSGTSMATPMISGLVALMLQAHPGWTPDQVKGALTNPSVASNPSLKEVNAAKVLALQNPAPADRGLTPNRLVNGATGAINYSQSSWSQSSWSQASGSLAAAFAQSSWSCTCTASSNGGVGPSTSSWSTSSWSTYFDDTSKGD